MNMWFARNVGNVITSWGNLVAFKGLREISENVGRFPFYGISLTKCRESLGLARQVDPTCSLGVR